MAPTGSPFPGSPYDNTKPFHPRSVCTDSSKFHRNTRYIKSESTYNSDEESDKHTPSVVPRPAGQLLFSSLHPLLNRPEALQSGTYPPHSAHHPEQEAAANLCIHFPSLLAVPHPHLDGQTLRGWGAQDRDGATAAKLLGHAGQGLAIGGKKTLVLIKSGVLGP